MISDYTALGVAIISIIGNVIMFILSRKERETKKEVDETDIALRTTETYTRIIDSLNQYITTLEDTNKELVAERDTLKRILRENGFKRSTNG